MTVNDDMPSVVGPLESQSSLDIEAMARELLASGYLVQVRDGAQQERSRNTRSCLQNLRHRYIVCLGWRSSAASEPEYLPEPLVVEPCLREQFTIAHPTPQYEALLQVSPEPCTAMAVGSHGASCCHACMQCFLAFLVTDHSQMTFTRVRLQMS